MEEKFRIDSFVVDMGDREYELSGECGKPAPDSVGSDEIINDSIRMEDLNGDVKDKMVTDDDRVTREDLDNFIV